MSSNTKAIADNQTVPESEIQNLLGNIHCQDCIVGLKTIPSGCVDLAFADPPFNIGYDYDVYDDRQEHEEYLKWSGLWIAEVHRVLKNDGAFWLAIGDEYAAQLKLLSQQIGFHCRSWVVWYYTFGVHCQNKFTRSHAHLFHFVKDPSKFTFNNQEVRVPSARQLVYNDARANPKGRMPDDTWILRPQDAIDAFDPDDDVWYFPRVAGTFKERAGFHGCQMPEQLLGRIVRSCSDDDDIVLDPFSGSATTLAVAKKLGRRWIGFELSADYQKLGLKRLEAIEQGDTLDGSPEPKISAPSTASRQKKKPNERFDSGLLDFDGLHDAGLLIEAYAQTNDGYSVDRLVADPILNSEFQSVCDVLGVEGTEAQRNRALFRLRKSGKLARASVVTDRRTNINWQQASRYIFASEIAWRKLFDNYQRSIDEILCDPKLANEFDKIAKKFAPGFSSLDYRWGALKLRKAASVARGRAAKLRIRRFDSLAAIEDLAWNQIPNENGVYAIYDSSENCLYAGETKNLNDRLARHFKSKLAMDVWQAISPGILVSWQNIETAQRGRLALQCSLVKRLRPEMNMVSQWVD